MSSSAATNCAQWEPNSLGWIKEGKIYFKVIVRKYADEKDIKKDDGIEKGYVLLYYPAQEGVNSQGMQAWVPGDSAVSVHSPMFSIIFVCLISYLVGSGASQAWRNPTRRDEDCRLIVRRGGGDQA